VNAYAGEFHWALPLPSYHVPGGWCGTSFWLIYRSQVAIDGVTGNWDVTFNQRLVEVQPGGDITCYTGTGRTGDTFVKNGSAWTPPDGWTCDLVKLAGFGGPGNSFRLDEASGAYREYDANGYLVLMGEPNGNTIQFTRNASAPHEVTSIVDDTGRASTLTYTNGRLVSFTDPTGTATTLAYDATTGWLASVTTPPVTFKDSTGTTVTRGIVTSFVYSTGNSPSYLNGNLLEIRDDAGIAQIKNTYDGSDKIATQQNALGGLWQFSYLGTSTDVLQPNGYKRTLDFDVDGRIIRIEDFTAKGMGQTALRTGEPDSFVTTIVRDTGCSCGAPQTVTLPDGTVWAYTRNGLGQATALTVTPGPGVAGGARTWAWSFAAPYAPTYARLTSATDPLGRVRTYGYDTKGNLTTLVQPVVTLGQPTNQTAQTLYQRTARGEISQITRPSGLVITYTRQAGTGYVLSETVDPSGVASTTTWTVDAAGRALTETDPLGATTTRTFDALGHVVHVSPPPGGAALAYVYDFRGHVVQTDEENRDQTGTLDPTNPQWTTTWTRNAAGFETARKEEVSKDVFLTTTNEWTVGGLLSRNVTPGGRETTIIHDERDLTFQVTQAPGTAIAATQTRDYGLTGRLSKLTNPLGRSWQYVTDAYGGMVTSTDPLGIKAEGTYDAAGLLVEARVKDAADVTVARTLFERDERGRIYKESDLLLDAAGVPTGTTSDVTTLYSAGDEILERTDATGRKATATYDALSRLKAATSPGGDVLEMTYDAASRPILLRYTDQVPGASPFTWRQSQAFDALGRRTSAAREDANGTPLETRAWVYDGLGAVVHTTDGLGNATDMTYDGLGRTLSVTRELRAGGTGSGALLGTVTTHATHDADGLVLSRTDDNGSVTSYTYDQRGRRTATTLAGGANWTYTYDLLSQVTGWTDPNGTVVTQVRDLLGRVTSRTITRAAGVLGPTGETYAWDALGRLTSTSDDDSTVSRSFDSLGRFLAETAGGVPVPGAPTTQFGHDLAGRITSLTYPDATVITRTFDLDGRLDLVQSGGATLVDLDWSGPRIVKRMLGGGSLRADSTFDGIGRLTRLAWTKQPSGTAIRTLDTLWDAAGRLRYEARADLGGKGDVFAYDSLSRVVDARFQVPNPPAEVTTPGSQTWATKNTYAVDGAQNRTSATTTQAGLAPVVTPYTHDTRNHYTLVGAAARTYSAKGERRADATHTYAYDYRSRLVEVKAAGSGALVATYGWDPLDRRDRRTVTGGVDERHYFAGHDLVAIHEVSGTGFRRANLVHGGSGVGPAVAWLRDESDANGNGNTTETIQVLCGQNLAGSLMFTADASGTEFEGYTYDDFGAVSTWTPAGAPRATSLLAIPGRFQGMAWDPETSLSRAGPRHYDPAAGRWLQADPLGTWGDPQGLGAESQALAHAATTHADPSGRIVVGIGGAGGSSNNHGVYDFADRLSQSLGEGNAQHGDVNGMHEGAGSGPFFIPGRKNPVYVSSSEPGRIAGLIAAEIKSKPCQPVILVGHSMGVATAVEVAKILAGKGKGICVDALIAFDGVRGPFWHKVSDMVAPGNVTRITNVHATGGKATNGPNTVRSLGGGFTPVTGGRPQAKVGDKLPMCVNPLDLWHSPGVYTDPQADHSTVTAPSGLGSRLAFADARRWKQRQGKGQFSNCCGGCKK